MNGTQFEEVAKKHGIRLLLEFGSTVTGKTHARSDLDLGVLLGRAKISMDEYSEITQALREILKPDREIDLAIIDRADPLFLKKVTDGCRLLWGSERELQRLKIYAFKRYQDHQKYFAMERRYVARSLASPPSK